MMDAKERKQLAAKRGKNKEKITNSEIYILRPLEILLHHVVDVVFKHECCFILNALRRMEA